MLTEPTLFCTHILQIILHPLPTHCEFRLYSGNARPAIYLPMPTILNLFDPPLLWIYFCSRPLTFFNGTALTANDSHIYLYFHHCNSHPHTRTSDQYCALWRTALWASPSLYMAYCIVTDASPVQIQSQRLYIPWKWPLTLIIQYCFAKLPYPSRIEMLYLFQLLSRLNSNFIDSHNFGQESPSWCQSLL